MSNRRKWYFPYGIDIEKESVNNARIETFRDDILGSLARETCQNSLDAARDENIPVVMIFEERNLDIGRYVDRESFINEIIPKSRKTWKEDDNSQEFLDRYEEILKNNRIRVLRIADYNTSGLERINWESLIENAGISVKDDAGSAGSFGIGKSAPFAASDLRMVFYNTRTVSGEEKAIGVTKFISFDNDDETTAQGVGYLGSKNKEPIREQYLFGFDERTKTGTDLLIIGFNQEDWEKRIIKSLIENFMLAIHKNMLYIRVGDKVLSKETMKDIIDSYSGKDYDQIKNYYSVLEKHEKGEAKEIVLDESFEEFGFKPEDGTLIISEGENANRSVLMTRQAGMKIKDRKNISGSIQFNGIFQATGTKFNQMLQKMENPNHDDWIAGRDGKNEREEKKLLAAMFRFMKDNVVDHFQEEIPDQVDAFGISDFLPNSLREECNESQAEESLESSIEKIKLSEKKDRRGEVESIDEETLEKELIKDGVIEGDKGGKNTPKDSQTENKGGEGLPGVGDEEGEYARGDSERELLQPDNKNFKETKKISYRIIEEDYKNGEYVMVINMNSLKTDNLKVEINLIGENGSSFKVDLEDSREERLDLLMKDNLLILKNPLKNNMYRVYFKIPYSERMKMGVKLYEYK